MSVIFKILYTTVVFIESVIFFSILTKILGANPSHPFINWLNDISLLFTRPFENILAEEICIDRFCTPLTPLISFIFFLILGFILSELSKTFSRTK